MRFHAFSDCFSVHGGMHKIMSASVADLHADIYIRLNLVFVVGKKCNILNLHCSRECTDKHFFIDIGIKLGIWLFIKKSVIHANSTTLINEKILLILNWQILLYRTFNLFSRQETIVRFFLWFTLITWEGRGCRQW